MAHPFEVGEEYRNRKGEYTVIELNEPQMVIEYEDGEILETTVNLQARIWRNVLMDEQAKRERRERKARARRRRRRKRRRGRGADGLEASDFKLGVTGTSWRRRENFGGLLAQTMTDATGDFFQSHAIYRKPEVHIAQPDDYKRKTRRNATKFFFRVDEEKATFGACVERDPGSSGDASHWQSVVNGLIEARDEVSQAMEAHNMYWELIRGDDVLLARVELADDALRWIGENVEKEIDWAGFQERLERLEEKKQYGLYLCADAEKAQVVQAGVEFANRAAEVYRALLPLYEIGTEGVAEEEEQSEEE